MQSLDFSSHYESPIGGMTMASDGTSLTGLWFDNQKYFASTVELPLECREQLLVFIETRRWLDCYFEGRDPVSTPPFVLRGTPFQMRVWDLLCTIPYGKTVTYGEMARRLGVRSAQAVGGAVGRNPVSIIVPCHRVVGANGTLTGYAGGIDRKRFLLQLERGALGVG